MNYRLIPTTELNASVISFGGNSLSEVNAQDFAFDQLDLYTEAGGNFIDTANIYGRWLDPGLNHSEIYTVTGWPPGTIATRSSWPPKGSSGLGRLDRASPEP